MFPTGVIEVHVQALLLAGEDIPDLIGLVVEGDICTALLRIGGLVVRT